MGSDSGGERRTGIKALTKWLGIGRGDIIETQKWALEGNLQDKHDQHCLLTVVVVLVIGF